MRTDSVGTCFDTVDAALADANTAHANGVADIRAYVDAVRAVVANEKASISADPVKSARLIRAFET